MSVRHRWEFISNGTKCIRCGLKGTTRSIPDGRRGRGHHKIERLQFRVRGDDGNLVWTDQAGRCPGPKEKKATRSA